MQSHGLKATLVWLTLFCIAIGYLESSVVIYLRALYYPSGFAFPLSVMSENIAFTEVVREIVTLIILLSIAHLAGHNQRQRFAWFLYCFAIWDIFYYVFLKLLINWPESLLTWDVLFLIPTTWTGPVIAPIIISLTMILLAGMMLFIEEKIPLFSISWLVRTIIIIGAGIVFLSFVLDYSLFMLKHCTFSGLLHSDVVQEAMRMYIPVHFNWWLFLAGLSVIFAGQLGVFFQAMKMIKRK